MYGFGKSKPGPTDGRLWIGIRQLDAFLVQPPYVEKKRTIIRIRNFRRDSNLDLSVGIYRTHDITVASMVRDNQTA